jgi:glycosyltransferase involved in cell wall biosynthesis
MSPHPAISVIMAVYNGQQYIKEAINSVLNQQFHDFEFIIIDDGSTDNSLKIIQEYQKQDSRIVVIQNETNIGLPASLNKGLDLAKGLYIARMDGDDINDLSRLKKQVEFLEENPDIDILGCELNIINQDGTETGQKWSYLTAPSEIAISCFFESPVPHASIMIRSKIFNENKVRYNEKYRVAQDYELWSRLITNYKFSNLNEALYHCRFVRGNVINPLRKQLTEEIRRNQLITRLNITPTDKEWEIHQFIFGFNKGFNYELNAKALLSWLNKIACKIEENKISTKAEFYNYLKKKNYIEIQLRSHLRNKKSDLFKVLQIIWGIDKDALQKRLKLTFKFFKDLLS